MSTAVPNKSESQRDAEQLIDDNNNPASLSTNPNKKVARNKPIVKPPFSDVSMGRFLTYLVLGLLLLATFYIYRFTVWAADAGGYWNLLTGRTVPPKPSSSVAESIASVASASASSATGNLKATGAPKPNADVQSQIFNLAQALGVKPADLSSAIRPLIDPSAPNPAEQAAKERDLLKAQLAAQEGAGGSTAPKVDQKAAEGSLLGMMGEALLD